MEDDEFADAAERMEGVALRGKGRGGRDRRGGGGRGGAKGQGREMLISKALSSLLRHQAENVGIKLDAEGYAPLDKVIQWPRIRSLNPSFDEIRSSVADNAKQRFAMKPKDPSTDPESAPADPAAWLIRANQGHSIALEAEAIHTPVTLEDANVPPIVVHGTYFAFWPAIVASGGLKRMGRQHVHFGTGLLPEDGEAGGGISRGVVSGMRSDAELLVFADVQKSLREDSGMKWWVSANGVVLTDGNEDGLVPLKYIKEVRGRKQGVGVLWRDGEKVADLPLDVVARAPVGKGRGGGGAGAGAGRGGRGGRRGGRGGGQGEVK
ncbi:KptA family-domain-containing protein [Daldinia decipiens]|uniref:KptA family-domain-containing protein n=1 Tax=Daldinia decipiens TaxID=326647 RepID=UPI0020C21581|nr:KptA family-domain-containing protein [Daldinia decipiens]KAI1661565.1 KptA family-domain-containing protein [Daldinia decipiens]